MIALFDFDLPRAVTEQLIERLESMESSQLTDSSLAGISEFQQQHKIVQGVYQVLLGNVVKYVGKAADLRERLEQHWHKLRGRRNLDITEVRFKAFLLHPNWATSANESLLIGYYRKRGECEWNGAGFGPKDVGRPRDTTKPNRFDSQYPINDEWLIDGIIEKGETVGSVVDKVKQQVPFVFRYEIPNELRARPVALRGIKHTARDLIAAVTETLGTGWQATLLKSHIILYRESREYPYGTVRWPI